MQTFGLEIFWQCVGVAVHLWCSFVRICIGCALSTIILFSFFNFEMITIIYRRPSLKSNLHQSKCRMEYTISARSCCAFCSNAGDYLQFCSIVYLCVLNFLCRLTCRQNLLLNNFSVLPTLYAYMNVCSIGVCLVAQFTNIHLYICKRTFIKFQT